MPPAPPFPTPCIPQKFYISNPIQSNISHRSFFPSLIADSAAAAPSAFPVVAPAFELPAAALVAAALVVAASSFSASSNHSAISAARSYPPALSVLALPFVLVPVVEPVLLLPNSRIVKVVLS